ncbi:UDP-glucose--hexose-1-phosphate uridylyltransferase [Carnobacterium sp. TMP28]|uniref:UDP-glucose--hexose-1-phosphate uridylyltransferase n=1 Tax=Carnobacterium sp. TMP28 TaxID=3397060 RepID=UPI0039E16DA3
MNTIENVDQLIIDFIEIGCQKKEIESLDKILKTNQLLQLVGKIDFDPTLKASKHLSKRLELLDQLIHYAVESDKISDLQTEREVLKAEIMNLVTPLTSEVNRQFWARYASSPKQATDYFYDLSRDNDYIKTRQIVKNSHFISQSSFGPLEITINLSKPEKDPKQIALAKQSTSTSYPTCLLCMENEGYAGHFNHPARSNHRIVRMPLNGEGWGLQYSPYAYYDEHCIFLSQEHKPMKLEKATFEKLLGIVEQFPHYFVGSNADLPIVGGSILTHDHYQGGRHTFAMEQAKITHSFDLKGFSSIEAGLVQWPMSVIRLKGSNKAEIIDAATLILEEWRIYSDSSVSILAQTEGVSHNTVTPIARMNGDKFELDLVLRNNRVTVEFPDGIFHPHADVQHIKKENIGLIEVMGLAILPPRLKAELKEVERYLLDQENDMAESHREWAKEIKVQTKPTTENVQELIDKAVGEVFLRVLEDAGVYKQTDEGQAAFKSFIQTIQ